MTSEEIQAIVDDLDAISPYIPNGTRTEDRAMRRSLKVASDILAWLPDEVVANIPHANVIGRS